MLASKLVFLDSREARAMAAIFCDWFRGTDKDPCEATDEWSSKAGLDMRYADAHRLGNSLLEAGIVGEEDEQPFLDPDAAAFIKQAAYAAAGCKMDVITLDQFDQLMPAAKAVFDEEARKLIEPLKRQLREVTAERDQLAESLKAMSRENVDLRRSLVGLEPHRSPHEAATFDPTGHATGCTAFECVSHCRQPKKVAEPSDV